MSKAFTREPSGDEGDDDEVGLPPIPAGSKNYLTPGGYARLRAELDDLIDRERPEIVKIVSWAASNGDRSENGDYLYGKRRMREIDRRLRYLKRQLDRSEVIDPATRESDQVFFGATVTVEGADAKPRTVSIVGIDEADVGRGYISWLSPMARVLTKAREGDSVQLPTPNGVEELDVIEVKYQALDIPRFVPTPSQR